MRASILLAIFLTVAACSTTGQSAPPSAPPSPQSTAAAASKVLGVDPTPPPGAEVVSRGCGNTPVYRGAIPEWASVNAPRFLPYVIATPDLVMGYLFSFPLHAGPGGNKILWYVRAPREGKPLTAEGHPIGAPGPIARFSKPADSFPGEIYPSGPEVPTPGCWHFRLSWNGNSADVDLLFE